MPIVVDNDDDDDDDGDDVILIRNSSMALKNVQRVIYILCMLRRANFKQK
jgi:hypothetical protein